jgi:hypothetical protein
VACPVRAAGSAESHFCRRTSRRSHSSVVECLLSQWRGGERGDDGGQREESIPVQPIRMTELERFPGSTYRTVSVGVAGHYDEYLKCLSNNGNQRAVHKGSLVIGRHHIRGDQMLLAAAAARKVSAPPARSLLPCICRAPNSLPMTCRARERRLMTVPTGTPRVSAVSL